MLPSVSRHHRAQRHGCRKLSRLGDIAASSRLVAHSSASAGELAGLSSASLAPARPLGAELQPEPTTRLELQFAALGNVLYLQHKSGRALLPVQLCARGAIDPTNFPICA